MTDAIKNVVDPKALPLDEFLRGGRQVTFYHLTDPVYRAQSILRDGVIRTTESNVGSPTPKRQPYGEHVGPDVVWLLDELPATLEHMHHGLNVEKQGYVFEVNVPAIRWLDWTWAAAMNPDWRADLIASGGGMEDAEHWYVFPAPIKRPLWTNHYAL